MSIELTRRRWLKSSVAATAGIALTTAPFSQLFDQEEESVTRNSKALNFNIMRSLETIGNTPLIKLERLSEPNAAEIYVKYEGGNPTGSMKDRMALSMIEGAERRDNLKAGGTIVEYTGGSTGSSLAMVGAIGH